MKISVCYIYPANSGSQYTDMAARFIESYYENPPGLPHETIVVLNDARKTPAIECLFSPLQNVTFLERGNEGFDCGGHQDAAARFPSDMMVFFGSSSYLRIPGWLSRMAQAFVRHGPTLYGVMGHKGDKVRGIHPHVRSTGFWCPSELMNRYPQRITRADQRYGFEHGPSCFANWVKARGLKVWVVDASGTAYAERDWDNIPGGFHKSNQYNLMCGDRLTEIPYHHCS